MDISDVTQNKSFSHEKGYENCKSILKMDEFVIL